MLLLIYYASPESLLVSRRFHAFLIQFSDLKTWMLTKYCGVVIFNAIIVWKKYTLHGYIWGM